MDDAIDANADVADSILEVALLNFGLSWESDPNDPTRHWHSTATQTDVSKAHMTIRQFYRDWSVEGSRERQVCYEPVIGDLRDEFAAAANRGEVRVLVPGAGLGRLVFDACLEGFSVEGNELSYHQLFASSWALNYTQGAQSHAVYPFALNFSNLVNRNQQLAKTMIPDVHPASAMLALMEGGGNMGSMSMAAGEFVQIYSDVSHRETFDAIATVFFIDTASNPIRYIETIHHSLKPNGIWINVGPLLWHFSEERQQQQETDDPGNVELTEDEVIQLLERMGFWMEKRVPEEDLAECGYIQDPQSMLQNLYRPSHWVARKVKS